MLDDSIAVITLTRGRPMLLERAIASVRRQDHRGPIEHIVVVDDDADTDDHLQRLAGRSHPSGVRVVPHLQRRPPDERGPAGDRRGSVYPRLSRLLNIGIGLATASWVAFLDDDNEFEPFHLSSLYALAMRQGTQAVHSARKMLWRDGSPYLEPIFPGASDPEEGARIYQLMCERGVWVEGTNILRDRVDAEQSSFRTSVAITENDPTFLVDQNLWLVARTVLLRLPIPEDFTADDVLNNTCPDDKMLERLVRNGVAIAASDIPSVRYYLGGISNGQEQPSASRDA